MRRIDVYSSRYLVLSRWKHACFLDLITICTLFFTCPYFEMHASREHLPFRTPGYVLLFVTCLSANCWDQISRICRVLTRLSTLNTSRYSLDFAFKKKCYCSILGPDIRLKYVENCNTFFVDGLLSNEIRIVHT